jgi:hypothetical protein
MRRGGRRRGWLAALLSEWWIVLVFGRMVAGSCGWGKGESKLERSRIVGAGGSRSLKLVRLVNVRGWMMGGGRMRSVEG